MRMAMNARRRRLAIGLATLPAWWLATGCATLAQGLKGDEQVLLFPSTAGRLPDGRGQARIEGWVHELEGRPGAPPILAYWLGLDLDEVPDADRARFEARTQLFRIDSERGRVLQIRFGSQAPLSLPPSAADGRISAAVSVDSAHSGDHPVWLEYEVIMRAEDPRSFIGRVLWLAERGLSVVSDIDDTIKHTQVRDRREMLLNTFAREFTACPAWRPGCGGAPPRTRR